MFPNERKASEKHPDFTGQGLVNGVEMWVSMWVKRSNKSGEEFFSISVRPKDEARREGAQRQEQARVQQAYDDDGYGGRQGGPPPRQAPSRFQRPTQQQRAPQPPMEAQEYPDDMSDQWEREP